MGDRARSNAPHGRRAAAGMRRYAVVCCLLSGVALSPTATDRPGARPPFDAAPIAGAPAAEPTVVAPAVATTTDLGARPTDATTGDPTVRPGALPEFTHRSAEIAQVAHRPVTLRIEALGIEAPIAATGRDHTGQLDVPKDAGTVAWYREGSVPGTAGSSVLAAHVDYDGRRGVFFDLPALRPGDVVRVDFDDGRTRTFEVVAQRRYAKQRLPVDRLFTRDGDAVLTLITCGGRFDAATRSYDENTVVQAVLR